MGNPSGFRKGTSKRVQDIGPKRRGYATIISRTDWRHKRDFPYPLSAVSVAAVRAPTPWLRLSAASGL